MKFNLEKNIELENLLTQEKNIFNKVNQLFKNDDNIKGIEDVKDKDINKKIYKEDKNKNMKSIQNIINSKGSINKNEDNDKQKKKRKNKRKKKTQKRKRVEKKNKKYVESNKKYSKKITRNKIKKKILHSDSKNSIHSKKNKDNEKDLIELLKQKLKALKGKVAIIQNNQKL